jgi:SNF2 family DNA or RNA helicase
MEIRSIPTLQEIFQGEDIKVDGKVARLYKTTVKTKRKEIKLLFSRSFYKRVEVKFDSDLVDPKILPIIQSYCDKFNCIKDIGDTKTFVEEIQSAGAQVDLDQEIQDFIVRLEKLKKSTMNNLKKDLREYQRVGASFMAANQRCICADEMGLGKTIELLSCCIWLKANEDIKRVLIILPAGLLYNWQSEIQTFTEEKITIIDGSPKVRKKLYQDIQQGADDSFFVLINYEKTVKKTDLDNLLKINWDVIVLDEGQRIKNQTTKQAKAVKELGSKCKIKFVLTGTPLENRLEELFSIMTFIDPLVFGSYQRFKDWHFVMGGWENREIQGYKNLELCNKKVKSAMIRRKKDEVAKELPPKIIRNIHLPLSEYQKYIYRTIDRKARRCIKRRDFIRIGALFSLLRLLCDDSELVKLSDSPLVDDLFEREEIDSSSSKLATLLEIVQETMESGKKMVIFTQWVRMARIIEEKIKELGFRPLYVDGSLGKKEKQWQVWRLWGSENPENDYFKEKPTDLDAYKILITTDSLSYGQNLHCASVLVNFDILYNPKKQEQRDARIHRLGIKDTKIIINLITKGTVEQRILKLQKEKRELFDDVIEKNLNSAEHTSNMELIIRIIEGDEDDFDFF